MWLYYRFNLSHRDVEDLLAKRGIIVSYESVRLWCNKFGPQYAWKLEKRHQGFGDTFFIDEVFVRIQGKQQYLWRAVDQDGEVVNLDEVPSLQKRQVAKPLSSYESSSQQRNEAIYLAHRSGGYSMRAIADYFGLHYSSVSKIIKSFDDLRFKT